MNGLFSHSALRWLVHAHTAIRSLSLPSSMHSNRSPSRSPTPEGDTVKVGKLTKNVTASHLEEIFDVYGKILDIDLPIDKKSESIL